MTGPIQYLICCINSSGWDEYIEYFICSQKIIIDGFMGLSSFMLWGAPGVTWQFTDIMWPLWRLWYSLEWRKGVQIMHMINLYIMNIFPSRLYSVNLTIFGLVRSNDVTDTFTHSSPVYCYRMLVLYCSNIPLKVMNNSDWRKSFDCEKQADDFFHSQQTWLAKIWRWIKETSLRYHTIP